MSKYEYYGDRDEPWYTEIFVFGSNTAGIHGKGAALDAKRLYGAQLGIGEGPSGRSYALPTKDNNIKTLPLEVIQKNIEVFKAHALERRYNLRFFVTRVGCGLAGYDDSQISVLFKDSPGNCRFHINWRPYLE
jgi:hypothetical protein